MYILVTEQDIDFVKQRYTGIQHGIEYTKLWKGHTIFVVVAKKKTYNEKNACGLLEYEVVDIIRII